MSHTDINKDHIVLKYLPAALHPYVMLVRMDRPVGIWLLLLPAWTSMVLASGGLGAFNLDDLRLIVLFGFGAFLMRSAGCIINDIWDRKLDAAVERTKQRPLVSGSVPLHHALILLFVLLFLSFLILIQLSLVAILLGILVVPLIVLYPFMKRMTWWPQAFLGITFNFGVLMGWAAMTGIVEWPSLILYIACIFWTLGYDTIYAHQDVEGDALVGLKSTALKLGDKSKMWVARFYVAFWALCFFAFWVGNAGALSFIILIAGIVYTYSMVNAWKPDDPQNTLITFKANQVCGLVLLIAACI